MAITVKHSKVSTIPDDADTSLVRPSDWNADHTLVGLGTMAEQDANNVAITGGTINGTTIGATTASTGAFTYLSTSSSTSTTPTLSFNGSNSPIASGATIPNSYLQFILQNKSGTAGASTNYVLSNDLGTDSTYYGEFGMNSSVYSASTPADFFSLNNGIYFSGHDGDMTLGSGNGYKTYLAWGTVGQSAHVINASGALGLNTNITGTSNFGTSGQVLTSAGSAATPTWNTPAIAGFTSGESTATPNGTVYVDYLQASAASTNADIAIVPKGTGAVLAQIPDNAATGGNKRGANAVDWQTARNAATQIASGAQSVIGGGNTNTASSTYATVAGGNNNLASGFGSTIGGGNSNIANNSYTVVAGGQGNNATQIRGAILGGDGNSALGYFNVIGGGALNSGTSNTVVTTQATTTVTSGSTAVTLSASNASIKVGQVITGTGINNAPYTYVAAISGTSLTLSQNATATGTPTLSFYTPHGIVVGGGNNQATGSYSFIGGGGDAGTAANRNVASGDWSTVCGGIKNVASGIGSFVGGGGTTGGSPLSNTASGVLSTIVGGWNNNANASYSTIGGGQSNQATGSYAFVGGGVSNNSNATNSTISGGAFGSARSIIGYQAFPAHNSPISSAIYGASQGALLILGRQTTDATATVLTSDTSAASTTNQVILPNNSAYYFKGSVIAGVTGAGDTKGWSIEGVIKRGAGVGTTTIVGTATVSSLYADAGAATWAVTATADTTNGGLKITVTGQAATTIRWVCELDTTEMTY